MSGSADLDEVTPNCFIVHNEKARAMLRGEGRLDGTHFELQTSRRDGWLARVRDVGFSVRTLQDRINALPGLPGDAQLGSEVLHPVTSNKDQWASFDWTRLRWRDLMLIEQRYQGRSQPAVRLRLGEPIRRRKSRTTGDFFLVVGQSAGQTNLEPISEEQALLRAYALAQTVQPVRLPVVAQDGQLLIKADALLLPPRHTAMLDLLAPDKPRWRFDAPTFGLARQVLGQLGIQLTER